MDIYAPKIAKNIINRAVVTLNKIRRVAADR